MLITDQIRMPQAKILYKDVPFSEDERENIKMKIQSNVYGYLGILLEGRERFEEEILGERRRKQSSDESNPSGKKCIDSLCFPHLSYVTDKTFIVLHKILFQFIYLCPEYFPFPH